MVVDADRNVVVVDSSASANASRVEEFVGQQHQLAAAAAVAVEQLAAAAALAAVAVAWPTSVASYVD